MSSQPTPLEAAPPGERAIRVFVSSTFRDMQAEREELVKRVFPQLRKLCESRGATWGEVDLRWGITDEQKAEGRVLPVCLEEIRRCRPYFIGLLGERYGWIPDEIDPELVAREPWLKDDRGRSVTELEIGHGVLNDPEMAEHSFFYLRDPAFVDSLPKEQQPFFREGPDPEEVAKHGPEEAEEGAEERRKKLAALKSSIEKSGLPVRDYSNPQVAGELILEDLTAVIDRLYPEGSEPDPLEREAAEHEAFARSRAGVYIGRSTYFDALDTHAAGDAPPLVVLGQSGAGKSALLANWARAYREAHPDVPVLMHFIGGSPQSTDWASMLRRIMGELARRFGIEGEIPERAEELRAAFANWLHVVAARGRVILLLDALNQLEDREGAPDLVWLPPAIPAAVRLVVSTLPGRPLEELARRRWPVLEVQLLEAHERSELIRDYLGQYRKELSPARAERIASADQCANPLFLRVVLEELRLWGEHETLDERIEHYLAAPAIPDLYRVVLERWEADYERERPGLVGDAMSLVWVARRGLSEAELLDLLGTGGEPLPAAHWSPFSLAAEQSLGKRAGLIGFAHDYLRQAVRDAYLPSEGGRRAARLRLADYFDPRRGDPRGVDEFPWQLAETASWERLCDLLVEPEFLKRAWDASRFDVMAYWAQIEAGSTLHMVDAYRPVIDQAEAEHAGQVAALLHGTGHLSEALTLEGHLVDHCREAGDRAGLAGWLGKQATILHVRGDLDGAMALHEKEELIYRALGNQADLAGSLGNQAIILQARGDLDGAMGLYKEAERICRALGNRSDLAVSLGNQANILSTRGDVDGAMALAREEERICRELGNPAGLELSLGHQATILHARGDVDGAMALFKEGERICRELGNRSGLAIHLGNQASILLYTRRDLDGAMALLKEKERIDRELGNRAVVAFYLGPQAFILHARGDLDGAMALLKEQERIYRELGDPAGLAMSLANQVGVLLKAGQPREALPLAEEAYGLATRHGLAEQVAQIEQILEAVRLRAR